jgi:hypothetical protein
MTDFAYAVAFIVALAAPLLAFILIVRKRWLKPGVIFFCIYVAIYFGLSFTGHYSVANHGGNDWRRELFAITRHPQEDQRRASRFLALHFGHAYSLIIWSGIKQPNLLNDHCDDS